MFKECFKTSIIVLPPANGAGCNTKLTLLLLTWELLNFAKFAEKQNLFLL